MHAPYAVEASHEDKARVVARVRCRLVKRRLPFKREHVIVRHLLKAPRTCRCDDVIGERARQQKQRAAGYRTERSRLGGLLLMGSPPVSSRRVSAGRG